MLAHISCPSVSSQVVTPLLAFLISMAEDGVKLIIPYAWRAYNEILWLIQESLVILSAALSF